MKTYGLTWSEWPEGVSLAEEHFHVLCQDEPQAQFKFLDLRKDYSISRF